MDVYDKPYLSPYDLINTHLATRGITYSASFTSAQAEDFLSKVSWFRFKSYLYPYLSHPTKNYIPGTKFEQGIHLYYFDCALRELCNKYILRVEVKARTIFDQVITSITNDSFWYLDDDFFYEPQNKIYNERQKVINYLKSSKTEFAQHYKNNYFSKNKSYRASPPFWMAIELMTFDSLMKFIDAIDTTKFTSSGINHLNVIGTRVGAASFKELKSWLHTLKELRNRSSHSNRTWNSNYRQPSGFVDNNNNLLAGSYLAYPPSLRNKVYLILCALNIISKKIIVPQGSFQNELKSLMISHSFIPNLEHSMGMPVNWLSDPLWN